MVRLWLRLVENSLLSAMICPSVSVSDELELRLLSHYAVTRSKADADFVMSDFAAAYAILGAQRATKILGIFTRLDRRDGKPAYTLVLFNSRKTGSTLALKTEDITVQAVREHIAASDALFTTQRSTILSVQEKI